MATASYGGSEHLAPALERGEAMRSQKKHSPKGIGIFSACLVAMALTIAATMWMASYVAPEAEESEGWLHEQRDRPATEIDDPRTIGD